MAAIRYFLKKTLTFVMLFIFCAADAFAGPKEEYDEATIEYLSAIVSVATYNDRAGRIAREELTNSGWYMKPFNEQFHGADAKFFFVENTTFKPGTEMYILAITGTESTRDIMIDLIFGKAFFGGDSPKTFIEATKKGDLTSKDPLVHRGFNKYTQAAFFTREENGETYGEYIADLLKEKNNRELYIVGHSLGGAVATIGAARLISLGVNPDQIKVITFGAPAVGNSVFAETYGKDIDLERVVVAGDPVKSTLQRVSGGYVQFGRQKVWKENHSVPKVSHSVIVYADSAVRNFYDKRELAFAAGYQDGQGSKQGSPMVYVAPPVIHLGEEIEEDAYYLEQSLKNTLQKKLNGFAFGEGQRGTLIEELEKARTAGGTYLIMQEANATKVQKMRHAYYVSLQEDIYSVKDGKLVDTMYHANGTRDFTPILANLHNVTHMDKQRKKVLDGKRKLP